MLRRCLSCGDFASRKLSLLFLAMKAKVDRMGDAHDSTSFFKLIKSFQTYSENGQEFLCSVSYHDGAACCRPKDVQTLAKWLESWGPKWKNTKKSSKETVKQVSNREKMIHSQAESFICTKIYIPWSTFLHHLSDKIIAFLSPLAPHQWCWLQGLPLLLCLQDFLENLRARPSPGPHPAALPPSHGAEAAEGPKQERKLELKLMSWPTHSPTHLPTYPALKNKKKKKKTHFSPNLGPPGCPSDSAAPAPWLQKPRRWRSNPPRRKPRESATNEATCAPLPVASEAKSLEENVRRIQTQKKTHRGLIS